MNCFPKACLSLPRRKQTQPSEGSGGSQLARQGQKGAGLERKERSQPRQALGEERGRTAGKQTRRERKEKAEGERSGKLEARIKGQKAEWEWAGRRQPLAPN